MNELLETSSFSGRTEWKPHFKQEQFLSLPTSIREGLYGGGAGSGKSDVLLVYPIVHRWHEHPRFKQVFMRRTFPELRNEIVPRSRDIYRKFGAEFNKSDMAWTFPSGAMVYLGHCDHEDDVHKYDSMEINLFTPDEITSFTEFIYMYIGFTRVRSSDPALPAIIRAAGMPGGIGHAWVKKRFIDHVKPGTVMQGRGANKRIYIHSTLADNPHIDPTYSQSLEALPAAERDAKKYGSWDAYLGQVFEEFRDKNYPDEPINALHVIPPFEIPEFWPKVIVGDWGFNAMTWLGYGAVSPDRRIYIYRERHWYKTKIEEWAPQLKEDIEMDRPKIIKFCRSAGQDRGQEQTIQQQIESAIGCPIELFTGNKGSRIAGKILLHEYLRWRQKPVIARDKVKFSETHAHWLMRNKGLAAYKKYLEQFDEVREETNLPKLQIFNTCPLLVNSIKACVYEKPKEGVKPEDVAEFEGDDPYDGIRGMLDSVERYYDESAAEFSQIQSRELLLAKLAETQDYTSFYRNAERLESAMRSDVGTSRYHRASRNSSTF